MKMKLKKATVAKFDERLIDSVWVHYMIDDKKMKNPICLYDSEQQMVIDINTGESYRLLGRTEDGRLAKDEFDKIDLNEEYALHVDKIDWNEFSPKEKMAILLRYYKILLSIKLSITGYTEQDKVWDKREAWKSNYTDEEKTKRLH